MIRNIPEPYERSGENLKVELDLSNSLIKTDLKGATGIVPSSWHQN